MLIASLILLGGTGSGSVVGVAVGVVLLGAEAPALVFNLYSHNTTHSHSHDVWHDTVQYKSSLGSLNVRQDSILEFLGEGEKSEAVLSRRCVSVGEDRESEEGEEGGVGGEGVQETQSCLIELCVLGDI